MTIGLPLHGAPNVADRIRIPPNGAAYISPLGDDHHGDGSSRQPWFTAQYAHDQGARDIVLKGGRYHQFVSQRWERELFIQNEPGERAVLIGSTRAVEWSHDQTTGLWWHPFVPLDHTPNALDLNNECAWATHPEQIWFEDQPLTMCDPAGRPREGEFRVDTIGRRLWVADDPTGHEVRIGTLTRAIAGQAGGTRPMMGLYGIEVREYVTTSLERAAVSVFADSAEVEHVVVDGCSAAGLSMRGGGQEVKFCTLTRCGQLGGHAYRAHDLTLFGLLIGDNNRKRFSRITEAGAFKITYSEFVHLQQNLLRGNWGHGLWLDLDSNDATFVRNVVESGLSSGLFFEMSDRCRMVGNYVEGCQVGLMASASNDVTLAYNSTRDCGTPWFIRTNDHRRPPVTSWVVVANDAGPDRTQPAAVPTAEMADLLELHPAQETEARAGWYGPIPTDPPPPTPEEPSMFDTTPMDGALDETQTLWQTAVTEIRRLEGVIANDPDAATIAALQTALTESRTTANQFAVDLMKEVSAAPGTAHAATKTQRDAVTAQLGIVTGERDQALGERDQLAGRLADVEAERDDVTAMLTERSAELAQALADLAECQGTNGPGDPPRLIVGGSDKLGYPDLKSRLTPALPGAFTQFVPLARFSASDLDKMQAYVADGVIPSVSVVPGTDLDTDYNMAQLRDRGLDTVFGGYSIGNEPTQKATPAATWRARNQYAASVLPPAWELVAGPFQRMDIHAAQGDPRFIGNWLGPDPSWVGRLGVNVYDKHHTNGQSFETLVTVVGESGFSVESYARSLGVKLWIRECGAPEEQTGAWSRPPGWKPTWYRSMYAYASAHLDLYELVNPFNSDVGGDPPPEGWWAWSTVPSLDAYREIVTASQT